MGASALRATWLDVDVGGKELGALANAPGVAVAESAAVGVDSVVVVMVATGGCPLPEFGSGVWVGAPDVGNGVLVGVLMVTGWGVLVWLGKSAKGGGKLTLFTL